MAKSSLNQAKHKGIIHYARFHLTFKKQFLIRGNDHKKYFSNWGKIIKGIPPDL